MLTLLAPALGGSTRLWAQAIIVLGTGLLVIVSPPRRSMGLPYNLALFGVVLAACAAFLPAEWFGLPWWRKILAENYEITLPGSLSAQPWMTLEAILLLSAGLLWAYYLFTRPWTPAARRCALEWISGGVIVLTLVAWAAHWTNWSIWSWPQKGELGFFPNRNHTSNLLALGGILACTLAAEDFRERRKRGLFWSAGLIPIILALVHIGSRAGCILFFVGFALWLVLSWAWAPSLRKAVVYGAILLLVLTPLFLGGERTLRRLEKDTFQPFLAGQDFRWRLQADALRVAASFPITGVGLGNFDPIIALSRHESALENRATHPESDWVWVVMELGWIGGSLVGVLVWLALVRSFPLAAGTQRGLRSGAMICGVAFVAHGLVDVPGHRMGTIWPAMLLLSLAVHPNHKLWISKITPVAARFAAIPLGLAAVLWIISSVETGGLPTSGTLARLETGMSSAIDPANAARVINASSAALSIAPLGWRAYYQRAAAEASSVETRDAAVLDFQRARFLEPNSSAVPMKEAELWLRIEPSLALPAWREALRRAPANARILYMEMLSLGGPALRSNLQQLTEESVDCQFVYLITAGPAEFSGELAKLFRLDPELTSLSPRDKARLFATWWRKGNKPELVKALDQRADWKKAGWRWLAEHAADQADYKTAFAIARQSIVAPALPSIERLKPLGDAEEEFARRPSDLSIGYQLHLAQIRDGKISEALHTIRKLAALPNHPRYVRLIEADLCAAEGDWKQAWQAMKLYGLPG